MTAPPLWTAEEVAEALEATATAPLDWAAQGVSIDSRTLEPGDLFVALEGPSFDGHDFVGKALEAGAVAAIAHRRPDGLAADAQLLMVEDTMKALTRLGEAARERSAAHFIGVTGSAGKTSTKEALADALARCGKTGASVASLNNHWGVPLSLARLPRDAEFGVFELGMSHPGEIRALTRLLRPEVAVITMIGAAHSENFSGPEAIADAKAEIFEGIIPGGAAVLPRDSAHYERLARHAESQGIGRIISFGAHQDASVRLLDCSLFAHCSAVTVRLRGQDLEFCLSLPGRHQIMNALAVLGVAKALGLDLGETAASFSRLRALKGRGRRYRILLSTGSFELIDDSYNANPHSMHAAFDVLSRLQPESGGRRIAVLGDMLELGQEADRLHAELAEPLAEAGTDLVFTCGPHMAALDKALPAGCSAGHSPDSAALAARLAEAVRPGDVILVKGSFGSRMARVVEALLALGELPPDPANGNEPERRHAL